MMGTRSEFVGSGKGAAECDVGLGLRMQAKESCPQAQRHEFHLSSSSCESSGCDCCFGGDSGGGAMFSNTSNQIACVGDIYDVVAAGSASGSGAGGTVVVSKASLYPFNPDSLFAFSSSGEMAASVNVRVPFTAAQWQELERQTMIYKYMMASVPVPSELLIPITKTPSNVAPSHSNVGKSSLELGLSSSNSDPEPWRCRRTDGKKWRCSRDVAPDQKYCERHSHKGRPRSRKPVELPAHFINSNTDHTVTHSLNLASTTSNPCQKPHFFNQTSVSPTVLSASSYDQARWFMKEETVPVAGSNQEWHQMLQSGVGLKRDSTKCGEKGWDFQQHYRDHPFNLQSERINEHCGLLLSPKLAFLEGTLNPNQTQRQETRHFIDAWSTAERDSLSIDGIENKCSSSSNEKLPLSSLTLSMAGGSEANDGNENANMGTFGIMGSERESIGAFKPQWMNPVSWMGSPPGGPLAEALCLGIAGTAKPTSNAASPHDCSSKSSCGDGSQGPNY